MARARTPEQKQRHYERNRKAYRARMADPERAEQERAKARAYYRRRMAMPKVLERERERGREKWRRRMARLGHIVGANGEMVAHRTTLLANDLYAAAHAAVPRGIPDFLRDDIISDLCLGVLAGDFQVSEISANVKAIAAKNRKDTGKYGPVSFDAPRFEDGGRTYHDTISEGLWQ